MIRSGVGFDVHRLVEGRPLVLGGERITHAKGLEGHSDADALLHAITDAILGAAALGDIGSHFPPDDPAWAGADSGDLLKKAGDLVSAEGWLVGNVDATVLAEAPRLGPHVEAMVANISDALSIEPGRVSVKATTMEGLGLIGREEGIAALAVAILHRSSDD